MHEESKKPVVFLVDDDEGLLVLMEAMLSESGYRIAAAKSAAAAMNWLAHNTPDLMLLDLKLQDLNAQAVLEKLRKIQREVPFIIVTGQGDERVAVDMMKKGARDYLVKDTSMMDRLPAIVGRALEDIARDRALAQAQSALQESRQQVLSVSEREQRRFGHDLHDGLGQQLTAIELMCESLREDVRAKAPELERQADAICQFLREAISHTRALARGLAPVNLEAEGLMDALRELARSTSALRRVGCRFECPDPVLLQDSTTAGHLFRIAQEAVNNALKHGRATAIVIRLAREKAALRLQVEDNGRGFKPNSKSGMGLEVMKHRATVIGAELHIKSSPGNGVSVACTLPSKA